MPRPEVLEIDLFYPTDVPPEMILEERQNLTHHLKISGALDPLL
jgi:hypothetical protein